MYEDGVDGDSLREVLSKACKRVDIGTAVLPKPLLTPDVDELLLDAGESREGVAPDDLVYLRSNRYSRTLNREFNAVVVEHHMKWTPLCVSEPGPLVGGVPSERLGRYDFHHADAIVDWALKHGMRVKGHVLCWHVTSPVAILENMSAEDVREQLRRHIFTTVGHFRGRIHVWDVVNEALAPDGSLADTIFLRKLGPTYIEECFRWAHQADPDAILLYNDNKVEGMNGPNAKKAEAFYQLLKDLVRQGVPIHGCGLQAHFNAAGVGRNRPPTPRMVKDQIHRLGNLGLKVNISELDVRVSQLPVEIQEAAQRQVYRDIVAAALTEHCTDGVWLWGFTDRHTWVTHFYCDDEPLIFDEDYCRKESYYGLREALSTLVPGGTLGANVPLDADADEDGAPWGNMWMQEEPRFFDQPPDADGTDEDIGESKPDWELT